MATVEHCLFCFETLAAELAGREAMGLADVQASYAAFLETDGPSPSGSGSTSNSASGSSSSSSTGSSTSLARPPAPSASYASTATAAHAALPDSPLFVTWNTTEGEPPGEHALRGCIGTFEALPIEEGLATYALTAALQDTRFAPVRRRELPLLEVAVTLLTDFEPAAGGVEDWEIGTHGLRIAFSVGGRRYGATYLPDVAAEQGWTKEETLISLMRKAGWTGRRSQWRDVDLRVVRYQGAKKSLPYAAFRRWRDWADGKAAAK